MLQAIRRVGLPALRVHTQPEDTTLVNFATLFYTDPAPVARTLTLLGRTVTVEAHPVAYTWHHGDGTTAVTTDPGAPYPTGTISYRYRDAHTTVHPHLEVAYTARYRVENGPWQTIPETVTITGPTADLTIAEATPVLSGNYR